MECLKQHQGQTEECRDVAKLYLECRMANNLMAPQDLRDLGFGEGQAPKVPLKPREAPRSKEKEGFIAGVSSFKRRQQQQQQQQQSK